MAVNTKMPLTNTADGYLCEGTDIRGCYFVIDKTENIPSTIAKTGSLCFCTDESKFYQFDGATWVEAKLGGVTNIATDTTLGLVKSTITGNVAERDYSVQVNTDGTMKVNVPWTDTITEDTNTWRKIQLNGEDKLNTNIDSNPLNIIAGNNVTITETNGAFTFEASDTWRPLGTGDADAAAGSHAHDDKYYTKTDIDTKLSGKSDNHEHPYLPDTTAYAGSSEAGGAATKISITDSTPKDVSYYPVYSAGTSEGQSMKASADLYYTGSTDWTSFNVGKNSGNGILTLHRGQYNNNAVYGNLQIAALKANRTYTFPDVSGTVVTTGNVSDILGTSKTTAAVGNHNHDDVYAPKTHYHTILAKDSNGNTETVGGPTSPVYFNEGYPAACTYTLEKSVPSNAIFTDSNVKQNTITTENLNYPILLGLNDSGAAQTGAVNKSSTLLYNPSTKKLTINEKEVSVNGHKHTTSDITDLDYETFSIAIKNSTGANVSVLAHDSTYTIAAGGATYNFKTPTDADTKNTVGSGNNSNTKLYLVGATSQDGKGITSYSNSEVFINSSNNLEAPAFYATSDKRLKQNIIDYSCDKSVLDLPIKKYEFISNPGKTYIGCIAQDLQEICPEIVNTNEDGYLSISESKIIYLLLDEVKKLKSELNNRIAAIEEQLNK